MMPAKVLTADPQKCTGCRTCEIACSVQHAQVSNPARARIRVAHWDAEKKFIPVSCQHCEEAISREPELERVAVDYHKCVGCRTCLYACPFGAMNFDADRGRPFKCNLCDGQPLCVELCEDKALTFTSPTALPYPRAREMARVYKRAIKRNP